MGPWDMGIWDPGIWVYGTLDMDPGYDPVLPTLVHPGITHPVYPPCTTPGTPTTVLGDTAVHGHG